MDPVIRQGEPKDFEPVLSLIREFAVFQNTPEKVTITASQMIAAGDLFKFYVAETSLMKIVGFATYFYAWYSWSGKALYLDDLYVREQFRAQGIGTQLFKRIVETAKNGHCIKVRWQVSNWNEHAIAYYLKTGATIDATELNCELHI